MTATRVLVQGILILSVLFNPGGGQALELKGRLATVVAADDSLLQQFNERVDTATLNSGQTGGGAHMKVAETVTSKVDFLVEKVMAILEMDPKLYGLMVVILPDTDSVRQVFMKENPRDHGYIAYYAPLEDTIYLAVNEVSLQVIAHEIAHAIIYHYFRVGPSEKIHELLAQYAASQMPE